MLSFITKLMVTSGVGAKDACLSDDTTKITSACLVGHFWINIHKLHIATPTKSICMVQD